MPKQLRRSQAALGFLCALAVHGRSPEASARSLTVDPVRIDLHDDRRIGVLRISNSDRAQVLLRVQAIKWEQIDGKDVYSPSDEVVVSPLAFALPPGRSQLIRVGLPDISAASSRAYRLIVDEVPQATDGGADIRIKLRISLPLYVKPATRGPDLAWSWSTDQGHPALLATNSGGRPIQVRRIEAATPGGSRQVLTSVPAVVLPNSARKWPMALPTGLAYRPLQLTVGTEAGEHTVEVAAR